MKSHLQRMLAAVAAPVGWGAACGWLTAPFWIVAVGGLAAAALAVWLEHEILLNAETRARRDFPLILAAGYAFLAVVGVGLASASYLGGEWLRR